MTIEASTNELHAELERRAAEQQQEAERRAEVLATAKRAWDEEILDRYPTIEDELQEAAKRHQDNAAQAIKDLDVNKAFAEYTHFHASRLARFHVRAAAQNANLRHGTDGTIITDLRFVEFDFVGFLKSNADRVVDDIGAQIAEGYNAWSQPSSYEEAVAYQQQRAEQEASRGH
ncbi:hypothetical protein AB4Y77_00085 [Paenarthrobacter sp. YAF11_1]|uniref:hypothetical protein n=1 Tax=Paenarthrobacter sp. YAF11_1 TaxID=3233074 RepID=UPI003F984AE2